MVISSGGPRKEAMDAKLRKFFEKQDKNGDGILDRNELVAAFKGLGAFRARRKASRALGHADGNGDGRINIQEELTQLVDYAIRNGYKVK